MKFDFLLVVILVLSVSCSKPATHSNQADYDSTLKKHLDAIQNHDLDALLSTVHDSVNLIFPNGQLLKTKKEFANFHNSWFKDSTWLLSPRILRSVKSDSVSYSLIEYQYNDIDSAGARINARRNYLLLVFKNGTGGWKLIHDQNTRISVQ